LAAAVAKALKSLAAAQLGLPVIESATLMPLPLASEMAVSISSDQS
jgi:hypothetical protein